MCFIALVKQVSSCLSAGANSNDSKITKKCYNPHNSPLSLYCPNKKISLTARAECSHCKIMLTLLGFKTVSFVSSVGNANNLCLYKRISRSTFFATFKNCFSYRVVITFKTSIYINNFNIFLLFIIAQIMFSLQIKVRAYTAYFYIVYHVF